MSRSRSSLRAAAMLSLAAVAAACNDQPSGPRPVASLVLAPAADTLEGCPYGDLSQCPRTRVQLAATLQDDRGQPLAGRAITWSVSDNAYAAVDANGVVSVKRWDAGGDEFRGRTVEVTATSEGVTGKAQVVVYPHIFTFRVLAPSRMVAGRTLQAQAMFRSFPNQGPNQSFLPLAEPAAWRSSNPAVVSVAADGTLRAHAAGTATITATAVRRTAEVRVTVLAAGYAVADLGEGVPADLNAAGQAVGTWGGRGVLWAGGQRSDLGAWTPQAINDAGQVVGHDAYRSYLWQGGQLSELAGLGAAAMDINASGQVAACCGARGEAFVWKDGVVTPLSLGPEYAQPGGPHWLGIRGIDPQGAVVGATFHLGISHVVRHAGSSTRTTEILGASRGFGARGTGINASGDAVGHHGNAPGAQSATLGVLWSGGNLVPLGSLGGDHTIPRALNDAGHVVGSSKDASGQTHAFLWTDGQMTRLADLLDGDGWTLTDAVSVNHAGQVLAVGRRAGSATDRVLLLTPAP